MNKATLAHDDCESADSPSITTEFYVAGDLFDPHACSHALGMEPTEIWRQKRPEVIARNDLSAVCWIMRKAKRRLYSVDDAVAEMLDAIWPSRQAILEFAVQNSVDVGITCNVTIYIDRPIYELSRITIQRLAEVRCEFGLDIFDYSEGD